VKSEGRPACWVVGGRGGKERAFGLVYDGICNVTRDEHGICVGDIRGS
jgi:hypothetical protein